MRSARFTLGRIADPEEVAEAVHPRHSDRASFVTGAELSSTAASRRLGATASAKLRQIRTVEVARQPRRLWRPSGTVLRSA
jgi:hypothetical protein